MQEPDFKCRSDWSSYPVGKETWSFLKNKSFINILPALLPLLWTPEAPPWLQQISLEEALPISRIICCAFTQSNTQPTPTSNPTTGP